MVDCQQLIHIVFLGMVQGFTEFLPISSSAHLLLANRFLALPYYGKTFDLVLHLGSLGAVLYFFRADLKGVSAGMISFLRSKGRKWPENAEERWGAAVLVAMLPTSCIGFLVDPWVEKYLQSPWLMAGLLAGFGLLLGWSDYQAARREISSGSGYSLAAVNSWNWKKSFWLGIAQALAFIPGVSRSGVCLTVTRMWGLNRVQSVRLSMLMSIPVIAGAVCVKAFSGAIADLTIPWPLVCTGVASAALCSWCSLKMLEKAGQVLQLAACYRLVLALIIVIMLGLG
ncbi:MAG: undecaprenyl-diphosphate phosphatase [bacterium]|nr:undecaprenyl-diphosphate phosphatase [bacterium]